MEGRDLLFLGAFICLCGLFVVIPYLYWKILELQDMLSMVESGLASIISLTRSMNDSEKRTLEIIGHLNDRLYECEKRQLSDNGRSLEIQRVIDRLYDGVHSFLDEAASIRTVQIETRTICDGILSGSSLMVNDVQRLNEKVEALYRRMDSG